MELAPDDFILVTGATGLVGSHVVEEAHKRNLEVRALVRANSDTSLLDEWDIAKVTGDLNDAEALKSAVENASFVVHCAAKVGDWGPVEEYRKANVQGTEALMKAALASGSLKKFIHISSLGVYEARDHHGTDEREPPGTKGIDGYTLSKAETDLLVQKYIRENKLPAVILRPGFIYGPRDRTVLPRILEKLKAKKVKFLGTGKQLVNNTYVGNLVSAVFLAIENDNAIGEIYNLTDARLVSKREFMKTIAELAGIPVPTKSAPLVIAKSVAKMMDGLWRILGKREAPPISNAQVKFMGLNLDFSCEKAKRELSYSPSIDFKEGMKTAFEEIPS